MRVTIVTLEWGHFAVPKVEYGVIVHRIGIVVTVVPKFNEQLGVHKHGGSHFIQSANTTLNGFGENAASMGNLLRKEKVSLPKSFILV